MKVSVRSYVSPTLVLLAFDWPEAQGHNDFLGFAIRRTPGFLKPDAQTREESSWLPNRLTFKGPVEDTQNEALSNNAPIQRRELARDSRQSDSGHLRGGIPSTV
jgi:hypothetical protein